MTQGISSREFVRASEGFIAAMLRLQRENNADLTAVLEVGKLAYDAVTGATPADELPVASAAAMAMLAETVSALAQAARTVGGPAAFAENAQILIARWQQRLIMARIGDAAAPLADTQAQES